MTIVWDERVAAGGAEQLEKGPSVLEKMFDANAALDEYKRQMAGHIDKAVFDVVAGMPPAKPVMSIGTPITDDIAAVVDAYQYAYGEPMTTLHLPPAKAQALAAENPYSYTYVEPPHGEPYVDACWPVRSRLNAALPSCYHIPAVFRGAKIEVAPCPVSFSRLSVFWPATSFMPSPPPALASTYDPKFS